jgi:hypothetical protein
MHVETHAFQHRMPLRAAYVQSKSTGLRLVEPECGTHTTLGTNNDKRPLSWAFVIVGTESRNRTGTMSPSLDFESSASTSSAIPAI